MANDTFSLQQKCRDLGILFAPSTKKEDLEKMIAHTNRRKKGSVHPYEETMIENGTPMLAVSINDVKKEKRETILTTWMPSRKEDGVRAVMVLDKSLPPMFFTRGKNVDTLRPIAYTLKQFNHVRYDKIVLDGELVYRGDCLRLQAHFGLPARLNERTAAVAILRRSELDPDITDLFKLHFIAFDLPSCSNATANQRMELVKSIVYLLNDQWIRTVQTPGEDETNAMFFVRLFAEGYEGVILKNPESLYSWGKTRNGEWVKLKGLLNGMTDLDVTDTDRDAKTTYEGTISGLISSAVYHNMVASATIVDRDGKQIAGIPGFDHDTKMKMFSNPEEYLGRGIIFTGNGTTAKGLVNHARFVCWDDKAEMEG